MIDRGNRESKIRNWAASRSVCTPGYVRRKASWPPQPRSTDGHAVLPPVRDADATIRDVMSTCSSDRPIDMNCQPSSRTMMLREMPANSALRSRAQFRIGVRAR